MPEDDLRRAAQAHELRWYHIGHGGRFDPEDVHTWAEERERAQRVEHAEERRRRAPANPPRPMREGTIYFVGADDGPVKVGWTLDLAKRVETLQTGNPARLTVFGVLVGTQSREAGFHAQLREHRVRGEWFEREAAMALLADLQAGG